MIINVIWGPPGAGKTTYISERKGPNDLIYDFDILMRDLSGLDLYDHNYDLVSYLTDFRDYIIGRLKKENHLDTAWLIISYPDGKLKTDLEDIGSVFTLLKPDEQTCIDRINADPERKDKELWIQLIRDWFSKYEADPGKGVRDLDLKKEIRTIQTEIELRDSGGGDPHLVGYALKFNRDSDVLGYWTPFIERINPHALDSADMSNVVALFNHDVNMPLARNTIQSGIGSLTLETDAIGLKFDFTPTDTSYSRDLIANMKAGVVNQCSFAFTVADNDQAEEIVYDDQNGIYRRTINQIEKLYDVSVVTTPAYPDTEAVVGSRKLESTLTRGKEKMLLELDLLKFNAE